MSSQTNFIRFLYIHFGMEICLNEFPSNSFYMSNVSNMLISNEVFLFEFHKNRKMHFNDTIFFIKFVVSTTHSFLFMKLFMHYYLLIININIYFMLNCRVFNLYQNFKLVNFAILKWIKLKSHHLWILNECLILKFIHRIYLKLILFNINSFSS